MNIFKFNSDFALSEGNTKIHQVQIQQSHIYISPIHCSHENKCSSILNCIQQNHTDALHLHKLYYFCGIDAIKYLDHLKHA